MRFMDFITKNYRCKYLCEIRIPGPDMQALNNNMLIIISDLILFKKRMQYGTGSEFQ